MSEQEYRRKLVEHNTAVQAALAATTEPVRQYLKRYRLDLYPIDWLQDEIIALEALSAAPMSDRQQRLERLLLAMRVTLAASKDYRGDGVPVRSAIDDTIAEWIRQLEAALLVGSGEPDGNAENGIRTTDRPDHAGDSGTHQTRAATAGELSLQPGMEQGASNSDEVPAVAPLSAGTDQQKDCLGGHVWSGHGDGWSPSDWTRCDCGATTWAERKPRHKSAWTVPSQPSPLKTVHDLSSGKPLAHFYDYDYFEQVMRALRALDPSKPPTELAKRLAGFIDAYGVGFDNEDVAMLQDVQKALVRVAPKACRERPIQQLRDTLSMLCYFIWHRHMRPGEHMWSIPANEERDFDCILSDAIDELEQRRAMSAGVWTEEEFEAAKQRGSERAKQHITPPLDA